jgi:hypothetical protein
MQFNVFLKTPNIFQVSIWSSTAWSRFFRSWACCGINCGHIHCHSGFLVHSSFTSVIALRTRISIWLVLLTVFDLVVAFFLVGIPVA